MGEKFSILLRTGLNLGTLEDILRLLGLRANSEGISSEFINLYIASVCLIQLFVPSTLGGAKKFPCFWSLNCLKSLDLHVGFRNFCPNLFWIFIPDDISRTAIRFLGALRSIKARQLLFTIHCINYRLVSCLLGSLLATNQLQYFWN